VDKEKGFLRKRGLPLGCTMAMIALAIGILFFDVGTARATTYASVKVDDHYLSGPLPDGSGDKDAIIQADPKFTPFAVPFLMKQLPVAVKGTVQGTMRKYPYPRLIGFFTTKINNPPVTKAPPGPSPSMPKPPMGKPGEMPKMEVEHETDLGGTITVYIGEEMEQHSFNAPTLIYVPANVPHGVVVYGKDITVPIMYVDVFPEGRKGNEVSLPKLMSKLPDFKKGFPEKKTNPAGGNPPWNPAGGGKYGKYFFSGNNPNPSSPLPGSQLALLPGDVPGVPIEKSPLFIYTTEDPKFFESRPLHIPHAHPFDEYLAFFSTDAREPQKLGMEAHIYAFNSETHKMERRIFSKPFLSVMRKDKDLHTPLAHRNMTRKTGFIWMGINYDPKVFRDTGKRGTPDFIPAVKYGVSMQLHNEYYTQGRFNASKRGVLPQDLPEGVEGDGGFLVKLEPHSAYSCTKCHGAVVPALK
jgi:hypothetical protein